MHEAHMVGITFTNQACVHILQPFRCDTDGSPLICRALGVAAQPDRLPIYQDTMGFVIANLTKAGLDRSAVHTALVCVEGDFHAVEIWIINTPETQGQCGGGGMKQSYVN